MCLQRGGRFRGMTVQDDCTSSASKKRIEGDPDLLEYLKMCVKEAAKL